MKNSSKDGAEDSGKSLSLIQQFKNLEKEWDSLQKSKPLQSTRRCSTGSQNINNLTSFDQLMENSPRELMSSLQNWRSPSDGILRARSSCDVAVEEILIERRAAITSGKVKGRRLFEASEVEMDLDYDDGDHGETCSVISEREVIVNGSSSGNESRERGDERFPDALAKICASRPDSLSREEVVVEEKKVVGVRKVVERRRRGGDSKLRGGGGGGRFISAVAWLAFVLILVILGVVVISCNGKSLHERGRVRVPT